MDFWEFLGYKEDDLYDKKIKELDKLILHERTALLRWYVEEWRLQTDKVKEMLSNTVSDNLYELGIGIGVMENEC